MRKQENLSGKFFQDRKSICVDNFSNLKKLDDVQSPLAAFVFCNEGLGLAELLGELCLRDPGLLAALHQQITQQLLLFCIDALFQGFSDYLVDVSTNQS